MFKPSLPALLGHTALVLGLSVGAAHANQHVAPVLSIWDIALGQPVTDVPDKAVADIACGTAGGPPGQSLSSFADYKSCFPEASGLYEVQFIYDDEQDYIARALELEFRFLRGGTTVYAHPAIVSVLVDEDGIVQGRRIVTDDRVSAVERRNAFTLINNFKAQYSEWAITCADIPMQDGELPVGNEFVHQLCTGESPDGAIRVAIEASYLRKKGQLALNQQTQQVNTGYFESRTHFEEVLAPYSPAIAR